MKDSCLEEDGLVMMSVDEGFVGIQMLEAHDPGLSLRTIRLRDGLCRIGAHGENAFE